MSVPGKTAEWEDLGDIWSICFTAGRKPSSGPGGKGPETGADSHWRRVGLLARLSKHMPGCKNAVVLCSKLLRAFSIPKRTQEL